MSNRSSKNIKVFNKVDFSKHEQVNEQSQSQLINNRSSSQSNIFTT
jgi:hypothetical protein